jgi:4-hydroxy-3-polyprenylbenzoate decarboxylase
MAYADLHQHLKALEAAGLLIRVDRPINKDTEMHPLVRWQFRGGIAEKDRKAFLFTNVIDSKNRKYDIPVVVGALAASREIYRIGMNCPLEKINEVWTRAIAQPIAPKVVNEAPCQELEVAGLEHLPIPDETIDVALLSQALHHAAVAVPPDQWRSLSLRAGASRAGAGAG